ncbi:hypothetical protein LCGC14_0778820 [marine sediment metagenome]|uniref:Uncharacterized protein n=1 Tax=marine sediment metagenome TaxID=412755 RepID=A0A0F9SG02_9ZZZZ
MRKTTKKKTARRKPDPRTTVKLGIGDRLVLQRVVRERTRGNLALIRIAQEMLQRLGIDAAEARRINLRSNNGAVQWDLAQAIDKALRFDPFEIGLIKKSLLAMSTEGVLTVEDLSVCRKFIPDELAAAVKEKTHADTD